MSVKKSFSLADVYNKIFGDKPMTINSEKVAVPYKYSNLGDDNIYNEESSLFKYLNTSCRFGIMFGIIGGIYNYSMEGVMARKKTHQFMAKATSLELFK